MCHECAPDTLAFWSPRGLSVAGLAVSHELCSRLSLCFFSTCYLRLPTSESSSSQECARELRSKCWLVLGAARVWLGVGRCGAPPEMRDAAWAGVTVWGAGWSYLLVEMERCQSVHAVDRYYV